MARPKDHEKRAQIVSRARAWLAENGVAEASMASLARAVEVKRSTLYWYFPRQSELLVAIVEQIYIELGQAVASAAAGVSHPIDMVAAAVTAVVEFTTERTNEIRTLLEVAIRTASVDIESVTSVAVGTLGAQRAWLRQQLVKGIASGHVAACDPDHVIDLVRIFINGSLLSQILGVSTPHKELSALQARVLTPLRLDGAPTTH